MTSSRFSTVVYDSDTAVMFKPMYVCCLFEGRQNGQKQRRGRPLSGSKIENYLLQQWRSMMDDAAQITQQVDPAPSKACVVSKSLRHSESPADPVSKVLDDDDLLIEIIVRLGFPTSLVHAALVCKRWFHNASNPFFLRRFRKLHPPSLLGFYVDNITTEPHFVSIVPQSPELASVIRRASFGERNSIMDIRNGTVSVDSYSPATGDDCLSCYPLCPKRGMYSFSFPCHQIEEGNIKVVRSLLVNEEGGSFSHCYVVIESNNEGKTSIVHVYTLQDDVCCMHTTAVIELPCQQKWKPLLAGNKIYILALSSDIIVLDLMTMGFSTFKIPQELAIIGEGKETLLSRAGDHSSVYLIHLNELMLCIWLHKGDKCVLVDIICLWHSETLNLTSVLGRFSNLVNCETVYS